jgi:hypothetical protein
VTTGEPIGTTKSFHPVREIVLAVSFGSCLFLVPAVAHLFWWGSLLCDPYKFVSCVSRSIAARDKSYMRGRYTVAALIVEPLGSIVCGRSKPKITERPQAFPPRMLDPSGSMISAATALLTPSCERLG